MYTHDSYQRNNLYWLLLQCKGTVADTGDWLMELVHELQALGADASKANTPKKTLRIEEFDE